MQRSTSDTTKQADNPSLRHIVWANKIYARNSRWLAERVQNIARRLPERGRQPLEGFARNLRLLAVLVVDPNYAQRMLRLGPNLKAMLEGAIFGGILGFWTSYYLPDSFTNVIIISLLGLLISIPFLSFVNFLMVSGDIYYGQQDELQRSLAYQSSAFTLRVLTVLLAVLFLVYLFLHNWRDAVLLHLCIVFILSRMAYLGKMTQLRWQELADLDLDDEEMVVQSK